MPESSGTARLNRLLLVALCAVGAVPTAGAAQQSHAAKSDSAIGTVHFPTSCAASAQPIFNQAVALLHSFAFAQATDRFNLVLAADSGCAMAWWGIAVSAWGNPFAAGIKPAAQIQRGAAAIARGRSTGAATPRESGYIEAAARLFEHADSLPQRVRQVGYRDAMAKLAGGEPDDTEAAIFHALALASAADPTDQSYADQRAAGATLERLFAALPNHPGLAHYLIHAYDVPPLADRALAAAQRYSDIAPAVSHALHMPSHTFTRLGLWEESIAANHRAAAAAARERSTAEQLHATDYQAYAYLQLGQDQAVRRILDSLPLLAGQLDPRAITTGAPAAAGYFAIAAIPARYALERGAWAEAARLDPHPSPVPFADALTWFARALGGARSGDTVSAAGAIAQLQRLQGLLRGAGESYWSTTVDIQTGAAGAWLSLAVGRADEALDQMRAAAEREDGVEKNAITPGPLAPARELLGEMLLTEGQPAEALIQFEATLKREPNRLRALRGATAAARQAGNRAVARKYCGMLIRLLAHADQPLSCKDAERAR